MPGVLYDCVSRAGCFLSPPGRLAYCCVHRNRWSDPATGVRYNVQVAFVVRIRPNTYTVGQSTITHDGPVDTTGTYSDDELEWYTDAKERGAIILTNLVVSAVEHR